MRASSQRQVVLAACLLSAVAIAPIGSVRAQTSDYTQVAIPDAGGTSRFPTDQSNANAKVLVRRVAPSARIAVRSSLAQPVLQVEIQGYKDMICALTPTYLPTGLPDEASFHLRLKDRLFQKLSTLDAASMRKILQQAQTGGRAEQFAALFGMTLPAASGDLPRPGGPNSNRMANSHKHDLAAADQIKLNQGQEVPLAAVGGDDIECLTLPQIDAAIAEAKNVYGAVIDAMERRATGASKASGSSGLQVR